jgi:uncharacterized protein YecE (DUF72 family)
MTDAAGYVPIHVGTSGWMYRDWRERFYPKGLPQRRWLEFYSSRFDTVEVNNSFYILPKEATFARWRRETPSGFVMAVKASRYITHIRRLRDAGESVELFLARASALGDKIGPVLFQLPPRFPVDLDRLRDFLPALPTGIRAAFEFRDRSWEQDGVFELLDRAGAAFVLADRPGIRVPDVVTGGWSYIRFHQGGHAPHGVGYSREKLRRWAHRIRRLPNGEVYAYFNNDTGGAAVQDAATLMALLDMSVTD